MWLCWSLEPVLSGCGSSVFSSPSLAALQEDRCGIISSSFLSLTCLPDIQWCCPSSSTFTVLQSLGWNSLHLLAPSKNPQKLRSLFGHQMLGPAQQQTNVREQCHRRIKKKTQKYSGDQGADATPGKSPDLILACLLLLTSTSLFLL